MTDLARCRILLVEDEYMLALDLQTQLEDVGAVVLGPEPSVAAALRRVADEPRIDAAVLDVNLGGEFVFPVAEALTARRVPFVFSSGYHDSVTRDRYPEVMNCTKPIDMRSLLKTLGTLIDGAIASTDTP
ncbi:response regulator [Sphingomonas sp. PB2P19]|uniref:response regulator n=1 Tax=Sphingomonas rhamnosi TaxID=3096156 RepID=UPI002FCA14FD